MARHDSYIYRDSRTFFVSDGRRRPGFFVFFRSELAHMVAADLRKSSILLYLYLGTHVSGVRDGFRIGGGELQTKLQMNRSTLYKALGELRQADLVRLQPSQGDGFTRLELADVQGEPWPTKSQIDAVRTVRRLKRSDCPVENPEITVSHGRLDLSPMGHQLDEPFKSCDEPNSLSSRPCGNIDNSVDIVPNRRPHFRPGSIAAEDPPPLALTTAIWRKLLKHSSQSDEGDGIFSRARAGDELLLTELADQAGNDVAMRVHLVGRKPTIAVRQWLLCSLIEAGHWDRDGEGLP